MNSVKNGSARWRNALGLLVWMGLGAALRGWNLAGKPLSSIEVATIGFGLGQGFAGVRLDVPLAAKDLLAPLRFDPALGVGEVVARLAEQSTHPPLFFALMRGWLGWLTPPGAVVDIGAARSLSVLFGVLAIPAVFGLAAKLGRSWRAGHLAAALMALSPYGVYLAQEARHYTLVVLWSIASWACTLAAARSLRYLRPPAWRVAIAWVALTALGMATHYFYALVLLGQAGAIAWVALGQWRAGRRRGLLGVAWLRMAAIAVALAAAVAVWIPALGRASGSELTEWIRDDLSPAEWLLPPVRTLAWLVSMVVMLPVEGQPVAVVVASGVGLLALVGLGVWALGQGLRRSVAAQSRPMALDREDWALLVVGIAVPIAALWSFTYSGKGDLTVAPRYHFVYFPLVSLALALGWVGVWSPRPLAWPHPLLGRLRVGVSLPEANGRTVLGILLAASLVGAIVVASNGGFQKSRQGDRLLDLVQATGTGPVVFVQRIKTYAETRSAIALAYASERAAAKPQFLLLSGDPVGVSLPEANRQGSAADAPLAALLAQPEWPKEVWAIDTGLVLDLEAQGCQRIKLPKDFPPTGYRLRHFRCLAKP